MSKTIENSAQTRGKPFPWLGLITLAAAVFLSITSEMLPTGVLPDMSKTLGVTESQIGLLVTWFAFTVVLTSTALSHLTRRLPRHGLLVAVLIVFALSNALTAIAPSYEFVVASRVIGGMAHGLFWAVVGAYAAHLVPKEQIGRAVTITVAGGTMAFVFGVPIATAAGHVLGWQLSFIVLAGLMLVGALLVWKFLPPVDHYRAMKSADAASTDKSAQTDAAASVSGHLANPRLANPRLANPRLVNPRLVNPRLDPTVSAVALLCSITALTMVGHYTFYTYVAPFLIYGLGVDASSVAPLLFAFGIAGAGGLILTGTVFGPRPQLGLVVSLAMCAVSVTVLGIFTATLPVAIVAFVLWGLAFGALPPLLQTRLLHVASHRIRDTASAFYTTAFNAGIGGGALVGALLLDTVGLHVVPFVYVGILVAALALVIVSELVLRRRVAA